MDEARENGLPIELPHARPVRVCYLIDRLALGGTETQLLALIRNLNRDRAQPFLCLLDGSQPLSQSLEPDNCSVLRLSIRSLCRLGTVLAALRFAQYLRRHKIDVLQLYFPDSTYFGSIVGRLAGVPVIVRARNNLGHWLTPMHRWLGKMFRSLLTCTMTNSSNGRRALVQAERCRPRDVIVVPNGIDLDRFRNAVPAAPFGQRELKTIGIVANLRRVKRIDVLIDAVSRAREKLTQVELKIAGEGNERGALERQIASLGLQPHVQLIGSITDVPQFLESVDVAVLCSDSEGMSNSLLEYMAAGKAIVATAVGAATELIRHETSGLLTPPGNAAALADAILRLCLQPHFAAELGRAARDRAWSTYGRATMIRRFENLYFQWLWNHKLRRSGNVTSVRF